MCNGRKGYNIVDFHAQYNQINGHKRHEWYTSLRSSNPLLIFIQTQKNCVLHSPVF